MTVDFTCKVLVRKVSRRATECMCVCVCVFVGVSQSSDEVKQRFIQQEQQQLKVWVPKLFEVESSHSQVAAEAAATVSYVVCVCVAVCIDVWKRVAGPEQRTTTMWVINKLRQQLESYLTRTRKTFNLHFSLTFLQKHYKCVLVNVLLAVYSSSHSSNH